MLPCLFLLQLQRLGIWLTLFLLLIHLEVRAQETWPPTSGSAEVRLVGPVYEAELERQESEEYRVLNEVFKELGETPGSILPEVYLEHAEVRHYRFVIGYKADEEWGTIQDSMISADGQVSTDRIRILLSSNENREPGLELMARLHKEPNSERRVLEGFRFLLDSNGASTADWFREKVPWSDSETRNRLQTRRLIKQLLLTPLWHLGQFMVIRRSQNAPYLPVRLATQDLVLMRLCTELGSCPPEVLNKELYKFSKYLFVNNAQVAKQVCQGLGLELVSTEAVELAIRMKNYGFGVVVKQIRKHGVWVRGQSYRTGGMTLSQYKNSVTPKDQNVIDLNIIKRGGGLVWCQLNRTIIPQPRMTVYSPAKVGWRYGGGLGILHWRYSIKGKGGAALNLSGMNSGFRLAVLMEPEGHLMQLEQYTGTSHLSNPSPPIWFADGNTLYKVNRASVLIQRILYLPEGERSFWNYGGGIERTIHTLHTNRGAVRAKRTSPVGVVGMDLAPFIPWKLLDTHPIRIVLGANYSMATGLGISLMVGALTREAFNLLDF